MQRLRVGDAEVLVRLSARERQLVLAVAERRSVKEIAAELRIARSTVTSYLSDLYQQLHVEGRAGLLLWCIANPGVFRGQPVRRGLHKIGCSCEAIYCSAMRAANRPDQPEVEAA